MTPHQFLRANPGTLVIAASRHAADDLVREACEPALLGINRHTLRSLVYALSSEGLNARGLTPLRRIAGEAVAASLALPSGLKYLQGVCRFPGFPKALFRTLNDLRLDRVPKAVLQKTGRSGMDLAFLLERYDAELRRLELIDYPGLVEFAIEQARVDPPFPVLLLDLPLRTVAERELCQQLLKRAPAQMVVSRCEIVGSPTTRLEAVKRYALSGEPAPALADDASVGFISASSEALEFVEIARRCLHSGIAFDQTAILMRNPQRQGPLVREALERAGIPAYYVGGTEHPDLGGRAFMTLLKCREENYSASVFAEYLSLGQVPRGEETPSSSSWERLLRTTGVIESLPRWQSRLTALTEKFYDDYAKETDPDGKSSLGKENPRYQRISMNGVSREQLPGCPRDDHNVENDPPALLDATPNFRSRSKLLD